MKRQVGVVTVAPGWAFLPSGSPRADPPTLAEQGPSSLGDPSLAVSGAGPSAPPSPADGFSVLTCRSARHS